MQVEIEIFDSSLTDDKYAQPFDNDKNNALFIRDNTVYGKEPRFARASFNFSRLLVTSPNGKQVVYGNYLNEYDIKIDTPSMLPEDVVIDNPKVGIYEAELIALPDPMNLEVYDINDCVFLNGKIYKFTASVAYTGTVNSNMEEITLEGVTSNFRYKLKAYSPDAIQTYFLKSLKSLFCKLKKDMNFDVCDSECYKNYMVASVFITGQQSLTVQYQNSNITDDNENDFRNIFNYMNKNCGCVDC